MALRDTPIRRKIMLLMLVVSGAIVVLTCSAFFAYEFFTFRQSTVRHLTTLGEMIATNSTAALSFDNQEDAASVLSALRAEPHIVAAGLYDKAGHVFAKYPATLATDVLPQKLAKDGFQFGGTYLASTQPVVLAGQRLGTLYLQSDMGAMYERFQLYSVIVLLVVVASFLLAYGLSRLLQSQISGPILALAETARAVSGRRDYSVRAVKLGNDETGLLTEAFNQMLTQIHAQDDALRESEARLRAVLNSALSAVIVMDRHGKVLDWNARAEKMFGWPRDEALGRDFVDTIIPAPYREEHREGLAQFAKTGKSTIVWPIEMSALRRDGIVFPVELAINPLRTGDVLTFCAFVTDITERKRAEQEVQTLNQELERRVVERTAQLETANKELESFSYSVSHDLRAPLRHIDGYASMLTDHAGKALDDKSTRYLSVISQSAKRMGQLIDDLLTFSRHGRAELRHTEVDLNQMVRDVRANLQSDIGTRTITWRIEPLPTVIGDVAMLQQVFANLVGNAVKYTKNRPEALIEIGTIDGRPGEIVIYIRDNGAGFDMKYADKLFGVFQRLHSAHEFEGTGVGLANVQRIVQRHGGRVWAEGKVNEGASFFFALPAHPARNETKPAV